MFLLWHPSLTAINLSYTFPILETSATALCGTTGMSIRYWTRVFFCLSDSSSKENRKEGTNQKDIINKKRNEKRTCKHMSSDPNLSCLLYIVYSGFFYLHRGSTPYGPITTIMEFHRGFDHCLHEDSKLWGDFLFRFLPCFTSLQFNSLPMFAPKIDGLEGDLVLLWVGVWAYLQGDFCQF